MLYVTGKKTSDTSRKNYQDYLTTTNKGISVTEILDAMSKRISTNLNYRNNADQNHQI